MTFRDCFADLWHNPFRVSLDGGPAVVVANAARSGGETLQASARRRRGAGQLRYGAHRCRELQRCSWRFRSQCSTTCSPRSSAFASTSTPRACSTAPCATTARSRRPTESSSMRRRWPLRAMLSLVLGALLCSLASAHQSSVVFGDVVAVADQSRSRCSLRTRPLRSLGLSEIGPPARPSEAGADGSPAICQSESPSVTTAIPVLAAPSSTPSPRSPAVRPCFSSRSCCRSRSLCAALSYNLFFDVDPRHQCLLLAA